MLHDDAAAAAGRELRKTPRDIVRLASGIDEHAGIEMRGQGRGEAFCVLENVRVQITGVRRKQRGLFLDCGHHLGMRMPDVGHVVVDIEVGEPACIVQPHAGAAHDVQRPLVEELRARAEQALPARQRHRLVCRPRIVLESAAPALGQDLAADLPQTRHRTCGGGDRPLEHARALGIMADTPGMHQDRG